MNITQTVFLNRVIRLRYWNCESKVLDSHRMTLEVHLRRLGQLEVSQVESPEDKNLEGADLFVVGAHLVDEEHFSKWLRGLRGRLVRAGFIWIPVLILSECSFDGLVEMVVESIGDNWYFDIIAPRHMASLPIRVANLIRIHDHTLELKRYEAVLGDISKRVQVLEAELGLLSKQQSKTLSESGD